MTEFSGTYNYFDDMKGSSTKRNVDSSKLQYDYDDAESVSLIEAPPAVSLGDYLGVGLSSDSISAKSTSMFGVSSVDNSSGADFDTLPLVGRQLAASLPASGTKPNTNSANNNNSTKAAPYNLFKEFDFPFSEPKTAKARQGGSTRPSDAVGFNFGIETFLHGYELGFGRQPSFKRLTVDTIGSSVSSGPRKATAVQPVEARKPAEVRKPSAATGSAVSNNRRSSLLPPPFPAGVPGGDFAVDVDALLKGYLEPDSPRKSSTKRESTKAEFEGFDLEAFLNRNPNARAAPFPKKTPRTPLSTTAKAGSPTSGAKKPRTFEDAKQKEGYAYNYLDGNWVSDSSHSASTPTPRPSSRHSSWKKIPPPNRPKETNASDSKTASLLSITGAYSGNTPKQSDSKTKTASKPLLSVLPVCGPTEVNRQKGDALPTEYVWDDLGGSYGNANSALPLFPTAAPLTTSSKKTPTPATTSGDRRVSGEGSTGGQVAHQPEGILRRTSIRHPAAKNGSSFNNAVNSEAKRTAGIRRLGEFKNGGYWMSSFSKSSMGTDKTAGDKANEANIDARLARAKEEKTANEERKERVRAFMEKRKQQKIEEEKRRQEEAKQEREAEQQKAMQKQQEIAASLDLTGGSGINLMKAVHRQRKNQRSPDKKRQSMPQAPYLKDEAAVLRQNDAVQKDNSLSYDLDSAMKKRRGENQVKSVVIYVNDGQPKRDGVTITQLKNRPVIEVNCGTSDAPRFFNVDEFLAYKTTNEKTVASRMIGEIRKKFLAGTNTALLLSATETSEVGVFIAMRECIEDVYTNIPKGAEMMLSVAFVCGGLTEDLLGETSRLERTTFATSPYFGVTLDGVGYVKVTSQQQVIKLIADGYKAANYSKRSQQSSGIIVISLLLKQVKKDDVILSSLMITDAGINSNIYRSVLKRADPAPFALFYGALGGPTFSVSVLAVGESDTADCLQALHTQFTLCSINNKTNHVGSVTRFIELVESELSNNDSQMESGKRDVLKAQLAEAKAILKNPSTYVMRPSPEELAQSRRNTQKTIASGTPVFPVAVSRQQPKVVTPSKQLGNTAPSPSKEKPPGANLLPGRQGSVKSAQPTSFGKGEDPLAPAVSSVNDGYVNRNSKASTGFINFDEVSVQRTDSHNALKQRPKQNSIRKTLPGSTVIGPGGPAWPSQREIDLDIIDINSIGSLSSADEVNRSPAGTAAVGLSSHGSDVTSGSKAFSPSTKIRTLVLIDPQCKETSNVTYDNTLVIATTEDDFEEYEVDEVAELPSRAQSVDSNVLSLLCDTVMSGCNASILGADSRSSSASSVVLKTVVKTLLTRLSNGPTRGSMNVSIVKLNGESVTDLLVSNGKSQKLVVAISPIFGSCVHGVSNRRVKTFSEFDSLLTAAKKRGSGESGRDHGLIFCSIILKLRVDGDVLVCSLSASFAGENIGVYNSVLDQSPLVPRALYHYALGGPCFTVALLGIGGDEKRANLMLNVQKRLGEVCNRPTNPGSIVKFISGIRNDAEPTIRRNYEETRSPELKEILDRLQEMVRDAEGLLKDFEKNEPKAYLSEQDQKENENKNNGGTRAVEEKKTTAKSSSADDPTRIHSIICYGQDLRGGGTVAVQENTVFVSSPGGAIRFDGDEVITLDEGEQLRDSEYMNRVIGAFLSGKNTGIITAETSIRYAFSLRALRKVAYQVLGVMCSGAVKNSYVKGPISGELELSMTLVKDDISADLLPVDVEAMYHRFELEGTPITGPRIAGVTSHMVHSHEEFDHFMSVGIDNVYPALETEDPGMMVVVLNLRQKVTKPTEDVLVSSLIFTAVFDAVHHYIDVLQDDPNEPLDIFKSILAAPATTIALFGISDEDTNADILLNTMSEICRIQNTPAKVNSTSQLIKDLKEGIEKMQQRMKSANAEEKAFLKARIDAAERMIKDASALLKYPFAEAPREFVPLGAGKF